MFMAELLGTESIVNCTEIYPKMLDGPATMWRAVAKFSQSWTRGDRPRQSRA